MKYRQRARFFVDAIQWKGDNATEIADMVGDPELLGDKHGGLTVETADGLQVVRRGDFILKSEFGNVSVWAEDIFNHAYEAIQ